MIYKLSRDFREWPYWKRGTMFYFENDTGFVWGVNPKTMNTGSYPLRTSLASYLWLAKTEKGLMRKIKSKEAKS